MKNSIGFITFLLGLCFKGSSCQQIFTQEPSYTEVNPEADTELLCLVQNIGGECRWQKDGKPLGLYDGKYEWSGDPKSGVCSLKIKNVNIKFDDGVWECQVTSSSFESQDALASKAAKLVIREPPTSYSLFRNKNSVTDGSRITVVDSKEEIVRCESRQSNPAPLIQWMINDRDISEYSVQNNETEDGDSRRWKSISVLAYYFDKEDSDKELSCRIYHPAIVGEYFDSSVSLDVLYKPRVTISRTSSEEVIQEGKTSVVLTCESDANPAARVFWRKYGENAEPSYAENLELNPVARKDSGAYICQAENHIGLSDEASIELDVLFPPKILQVNPSEGLTVGVHNRSVLSCFAEGNPPPKYQWLQKLPSNQILKRGYEDSLIIEDTTYDHQGEYVCEAVSFIGSEKKIAQSEPLKMEVRGAPQVLRYSVAKEVEAISGRDVRLEMEVCSDPVPSRTTWDWGSLQVEAGKVLHGRYLAEDMIEHPNRDDCYIARLIVKSVNPEDSRRYFLDVENSHGTDRYAVALTVKDPVSMASVIGVVIALLVVFVILVIILLYAYKSQKMCFKDKLNKMDENIRKFDAEKGTNGIYDVKTRPEVTKNGDLNDKIWPENPKTFRIYSSQESPSKRASGNSSSSISSCPSKSVESVNRLLYAELQFPVTSNYGSMKKKSSSSHARAKLRKNEAPEEGS